MPLIEPGRKAPAFTLNDQHARPLSLAEFTGRAVILYFYPQDDTETCTREACAFRDLMPGFDAIDAAVLGVSPDDPASHTKFINKFGLNFTLLADPPGRGGVPRVCNRYGVWQEKTLYGRPYMGVVRTTYLIGPDGRVVRRWDRVRVAGHAEAVLQAAREI